MPGGVNDGSAGRGGQRLPRRKGDMGRIDLGLWLIFAGGAASAPNIPCGGGAPRGSVQWAGLLALTQDHYFLNMSCSGPGRYLMTVSRMLSSSSSGSSPQPGGMAFLGRVRLPSELASMAAWASASRSSFFLMPYCEGKGSQAGLAYSPPQYPAWVALMQYTAFLHGRNQPGGTHS